MPVPRHQGERPHYLQSQYNGPHKYNQYFYVRTGIIEEVDVDKYEMTVRWTGNQGVHTKARLVFLMPVLPVISEDFQKKGPWVFSDL